MNYLKTKLHAALIHTFFSLIAFSIVLYYMLTLWFPPPLFAAEGGWQALRIVLFVDIVLGPLLTFFVFTPEKSRRDLCIDLGVVLIIQISALSYGVYTAHSNRIVGISYLAHTQTAYPIRGDQLSLQGLSDQELYNFDPKQYPALVYTQRPEQNQFDAITKSAQGVMWGIHEYAQIDLMSPFDHHIDEFTIDNNQIQINYEGSFSSGQLNLSIQGEIKDFISDTSAK